MPGMRDATGGLRPKELVKPADQLIDETVRRIMGYGVALSDQVARFKGQRRQGAARECSADSGRHRRGAFRDRGTAGAASGREGRARLPRPCGVADRADAGAGLEQRPAGDDGLRARRARYGAGRGNHLGWDSTANAYVTRPASAYAAGALSASDASRGFWWSPSNRVLNGVAGTARPISWAISDPDTEAILGTLNAMAEDGRLQLWADEVARVILRTLEAMWAFAGQAVAAWNLLVPVVAQAADLLGGWDRLAWFAASLLMGRIVLSLIGGFLTFGRGLLLVVTGLAGMAGHAVAAATIFARLGLLMRGVLAAGFRLLRAGAVIAGTAIQWLGRALLLAGRAALANPILLVIAAIAGAAWVIYQNWDGIVGYFQDKIDRVRAAFDQGLLNGVLAALAEFNPFVLMMDAAEGLFHYLTGWDFGDIRRAIAEAFGFDPFTAIRSAAESFFVYLTGWSFADITAALTAAFDIDLFQMGVDMILSLWEGIKSVMGQLTAYVREQLSGLIPEMPAWLKGLGGGESSGGEGSDRPARGAVAGPAAVAPKPWAAVTAGQRALGGPVRAGQIYRWQEQGQELFVPRTDGEVISNRQLRALQAMAAAPAQIRVVAGGGRAGGSAPAAARPPRLEIGGITIHAAPGMSPADVARAVRRELQAVARERGLALHDGGEHD